jgi:hypothetical protein
VINKIFDNLKKFIKLNWNRRHYLIEATITLYLTKLLLILLPLNKLKGIHSSSGSKSISNRNQLYEIKWSLHHANKLALWKNKCLVQSIAGRWMLHRRGIASSLHFGVKKDMKDKLSAHAWLTVGDFEVVAAKENYKELINY